MTKRRLVYCLIVMSLAWAACPALGYVPESAQIINEYLKTTGSAKSLEVRQKRIYFDSRIEDGTAEFDETAKYVFPDRFRSDIVARTTSKTTIVNVDKALVILDGIVASEHEERYDVYKDLLLFRNQALLMDCLQGLGINTSQTWFTRFEGRIVIAVGDQPQWGRDPSTFYVDKKTFLPVRLYLNARGENGEALEILYLTWKTYGKTKFPSRIELYREQSLIREYKIKGISCELTFDESLFDVTSIKADLKQREVDETKPTEEPDNEIKKTIDGLDKIINKDPMAF